MVPTVPARCAGVHVQAIDLGVELNQADMRMPTDEKSRWGGAEFLDHRTVVARRLSTNVGHPNADAFQCETLMFWISQTCGSIVDVAMYRYKWFPARQFFRNTVPANVPGVPDRIAS